jgi:hypothetical protein
VPRFEYFMILSSTGLPNHNDEPNQLHLNILELSEDELKDKFICPFCCKPLDEKERLDGHLMDVN